MTDLDNCYVDPELVAFNDDLNAATEDLDFYADFPLQRGARILDIGCGTGELALRFAVDGYSVVAIDPSAAMLEVANAKPDSAAVEWRNTDIRSTSEYGSFDLAVMTGHAFQCLL